MLRYLNHTLPGPGIYSGTLFQIFLSFSCILIVTSFISFLFVSRFRLPERLLVIIDLSGLSHATKTIAEQLKSYHDEQKHRIILEWLSSTNFLAYQDGIRRGCQKGTGQWFVDSREFQLWLDGREPTLFCPGMPGAGKTAITSIVIDNLHKRFSHDPKVAVTFLYFNYKRPREQTIENLLASLLKQVLLARSDLPTEVETLYKFHSRNGTRPTVAELLDTLRVATRGFSRYFVLLDALDECRDRRIVINVLEELLTLQNYQPISLLATSRSIPELLAIFPKKSTIKIRAKDEDVRLFLEAQMTSLPSSIRRNITLRETIKSEIIAAVDGM